MKSINKFQLFLLCLFLTTAANATVTFTSQELELVKGACLAGKSFEFSTEADGTLSLRNLEGKGKLHITKKTWILSIYPILIKEKNLMILETALRIIY